MPKVIDKYSERFNKLIDKNSNMYEFHLQFCSGYQSCWINGSDIWYLKNHRIREYLDEIYDRNKPSHLNVWDVKSANIQNEDVDSDNHFIHFEDNDDNEFIMLDPLYEQNIEHFKYLKQIPIQSIY